MRDHQKVPDWVREWYDTLTAALCILDRVEVRMVPMDQDNDAQGKCEIMTRLLKAKVTLPYDIEADKDGYETVAHEVLHATQSELFNAKDQLLLLMPKENREAAEKIWLDALERWTERTSWGLTRTLSPLYAPEGKEDTSNQSKEEAKDNNDQA